MRLFYAMLFYITLLHSTTVTGQIFNGEDNSLMNNTLVTIEDLDGSIVAQQFFSNQYQLEIPSGNYTVRVYHYGNGTLEHYSDYRIQALQQTMQLDLILIPYELQVLVPGFISPPLANKYSNSTQINNLSPNGLPVNDYIFLYILLAIIVILLAYLIYRQIYPMSTAERTEENGRSRGKAKKPKEKMQVEKEQTLDEDSKRVLSILKENEGRMIQKELREILNFSETKMSLVITELEVLGIVKRIKKGRENILKLVD